jgi:hypothetical protein
MSNDSQNGKSPRQVIVLRREWKGSGGEKIVVPPAASSSGSVPPPMPWTFPHRICICVSTFSNASTSKERLEMTRQCLQSLRDNVLPRYPFATVLVHLDTGTPAHQKMLRQFPFPVIANENNMGIAYTKNRGIEAFMSRQECTHGFLLDDDLTVKDGSVFHLYVDAMVRGQVEHLLLKIWNRQMNTPVELNGARLVSSKAINGCFLAFSRKCIETAGYMEIPPHRKGGFEHVKFSRRIRSHGLIPNFLDVQEIQQNLDTYFGVENVEAESTWDKDGEGISKNTTWVFQNLDRRCNADGTLEPIVSSTD